MSSSLACLSHITPVIRSAPAIREERTFNIDADALTLDSLVLGRGAWGVVRAGVLHRDGARRAVAVKQLDDMTLEAEREQLRKEIRVLALASSRCSHVCQLLGTTMKDGRLCLVMPRYKQNVADLLSSPDSIGGLPTERALDLSIQVARALVDLHAVPIVVQDLKPSNLLLDDEGCLVVADFGISTSLGNRSKYMPSQARTALPLELLIRSLLGHS